MINPKLDCKRFEACFNGEKLLFDLFGCSNSFNCEKCTGFKPIDMKPLLKPCPFCGGEAEIKKDTTCMGHGDYGSCKWVKCKECGTSTKKYLCDGYYGCEMTDEELAEKWNTRV